MGKRQRRQPLLVTLRLGIYPPRRMQKMSKLILALAEQVLVQPTEKSSREAVAAALLLAHVAWNRAVAPLAAIKSAITERFSVRWKPKTRSACEN